MNIEVIGQRIDDIRKARKWSYKELANRIGDNISPQTVSDHIRTGKMNVAYLCKYAEALGCTVADITDGAVNLEDFELTTGIESYWPYNMILAVFMGYDKNKKRKIPEYIHTCYEAYVPAVLESLDTLTEREKDVLIMRYKHGMTLEEVGKHYGNINKERVRQIEAKALRKLRHPSRSLSWQFDTLNKWKDSEKKASALLLENINLKRKLERIGLSEEQIAEPEREPIQDDVRIDELELSVRSYNCLCRANIRYIKDLEGMTRAKLAKVRNLGRKSMEEVITKAREWGIEIKDD